MTAATCLWFAPGDAARAVALYEQVVPAFLVLGHRHLDQTDGPGTDVWEAQLDGMPVQVMGADGAQPFGMAMSISLRVTDQSALDAVWDGFLAAGGKELACGWVADPFGVMWQVVPQVFFDVMASGTQDQAQRVAEACWAMVRIDVAALEQAAKA